MSVLVLAEHDNSKLNTSTLNTLSAALLCGGTVSLLVAGYHCDELAESVSKIKGIDKVLFVNDEAFKNPLAEPLAELLLKLSENYSHILASATTFGKSVLPRIAAKRDVAMISDVINIVNSDTYIRPIYAGNILATVQSTDFLQVLSIRTTAFEPVSVEGGSATIETIQMLEFQGRSRYLNSKLTVSERPDLASAARVVSGGRGLGNADNFTLIEQLADTLNAAIGASRAAVDANYAPNDYQVGQTGKVIAPDLYIAVGISGAIQHLAGMKDSKVIVAINQDEDAPIFQIADYGLKADLFDALPELIQKLS